MVDSHSPAVVMPFLSTTKILVGGKPRTVNGENHMADEKKDEDLVLTPGGRRKRELVHSVHPGEAVRADERGVPKVVSGQSDVNHIRKERTMRADFVLTPGGFRHRSLVHRVEPNHALKFSEGKIRMMNLSTKALLDLAEEAPEPETLPALGSGWISYAWWNNGTGQSISSFRTTWQVPPSPNTDSGQTIFLFNGIQNFGTNYGILQPVLQWGPSAAGGGSYWSIASWYVTSGGQAFHTNLSPVNAGDTLTGVMTLTNQSGMSFDYTCEFQGRSGTRLPVTNIAELLWCNETLEAYDLEQCTDYPATERTDFRSISIQTGDVNPAITWTAVNAFTDCNQHTVIVDNSSTNGEVDIYYRRKKSRFEGVGILTVTNPLLLWLFNHGWEDPGWGRNEESQIVIASSISGLADQITDTETRDQIKALAAKIMSGSS